jgi:hypothetical protein
LIVADPSYASGEPPAAPILWITNDSVRNPGLLWGRLAAAFPTTGLWPLVLDSLSGADSRPWLDGELDPTGSSRPDGHDVEQLLAAWWDSVVPSDEEDDEALQALAPFGRAFPGLAPASAALPVATNAADEAARALSGRIGLVSVTRPADALTVLGWMGPVNHYGDMGMLSAVLRSWEDRFGATLVGVGFDIITLGVERPPSSTDLALAVAAEHFASCSDNVYQGAGSIEAYAQELASQHAWSFWWD